MVFIGTSLKSIIKYFKKKAVSNLDEESKWTVHYTAPWHQQENVFAPVSRPACVEELHRQAKVNLKTALRECDKLRKDGFRSSQYYSQGPTFSGSAHSYSSQQDDEDADAEDADNKSIASSGEQETRAHPMRAQTPVQREGPEVDGQELRYKTLPTPEEKMRQQAQAIVTDIVPINVTAAKGRGGELRPQSMFIPGHYSTLARSSSVCSTLMRSEKKDSGCQTEEVKIVPPSMRRIRAQRGQGIAAQMAGISTSATNVSTVSDGPSSGPPVRIMAPHCNGELLRCHSLPRGARVSLNAAPPCSSSPSGPGNGSATPPRHIGKLQADETVVHMRNTPRTSTPARPKSQEVRGSRGEWGSISGPACVVSPHAPYSTSLIPNATLSCSSEVIALHAAPIPNHQPHAEPLTMASTHNGVSSPSTTAGADTPEADTQRASQSDSSLTSHSTVAAGTASSDEQWIYDTPENVPSRRTLTSNCSTPIAQLYNSLEHSSKGTDSSSLYSMDNDGYYTSMHLDSGLTAKSHSVAGRPTRHSMYECMSQLGDRASWYSDRSLSRSISLRKCKKPPLPPARTDSLRRKPKHVSHANSAVDASSGSVLNESLIATLQQSLQNGLKGKGSSTSPSHSPCSDYEEPWLLRSRSQSSVSAGSSGVSAAGVANVYSICHVTPSQSDTSSLRSDYAESWGYYVDYPRPHSEQTVSSPHTNTLSSGGQPGSMANGQGIQATVAPAQGDVSAKPQANTSSPDRLHRLTSPSSGYSSQSNTPTAGTPVPSFMRSMSPSGCKPKPRVPERKSSLLSSVSISSSSTSLSSNTSDSTRNSIPPPPPPLPPSLTSAPLPLSSPACTISQTFPPPPSSALLSTPMQEASINLLSSNSSPEFPPPPPPEMLNDHSMSLNGSFSPTLHHHLPLPLPPPPPPPPHCPPIGCAYAPPTAPSLPTMTPAIPSPAHLVGIKDRLKPLSSVRRSSSIHSEESGRSAMPVITPFALQSVQLRSVKRPENSGVDSSKFQETGTNQMTTKPWTPEKLKKIEHLTVLPLASHSAPDKYGPPSPSSPQKKLPAHSSFAAMPLHEVKPVKELPSEQTCGLLGDSIDLNNVVPKDEVDGLERGLSPQNTTPKKKPPAVSKKPKFHISISASTPEHVQEVEEWTRASEKDAAEHQGLHEDVTVGSSSTEAQESLSVEEQEKENDESTTNSSSSGEMSESESSMPPTPSQAEEPSQTDIIQEAGAGEFKDTSEGEEEEEEYGEDEDGVGSTTGSVSSKDDENGEVFEPSTAGSSPAPGVNSNAFKDMVTPTRPRTTEDLFAAIHRSKRKVLGRRESEEDRSRGHASSPPTTPTELGPALSSSLPRQTGSIQRSLRKTATSSDTFKALLLKKGSRSETSFRMSATEMLRSTDPRSQRARSLDSTLDLASPTGAPDSPCASPSRSKRAPEDWARSEGVLPRYSLGTPPSMSPSSLMGPKYGRSRTPPSAASSKYNARSRILSSPMTVICEREGELAESGEGWDEPRPVSPAATPLVVPQDSSSTLSEEESS
ncbi:LOW QUALITY PROTEIN: NHS-like protein 1 [Electrophorus electricus]|uniref:LOW QUALITY PROTEIN: NHS-like protein 1 n=1 Tax=Electrophorus electricus TaxID=8005 RepID=UPI0015D08B2D|nr:LOW QUALITY PROTEIN: NHS-like protein 1 [Electrophorus electricus]